MQSFIDDGGENIYINSGSQTSVQKKQKHYILYVLYTLVSIVFDCTTLKPFYGARALEHLVLTRFRTQQKRSAQEEAITGRGLNRPWPIKERHHCPVTPSRPVTACFIQTSSSGAIKVATSWYSTRESILESGFFSANILQ